MDQATRIAFEVAGEAAPRHRLHPGELVGAAWQAASAVGRKLDAGPGLAAIAARRGVVNEVRRIKRNLKDEHRPLSIHAKADPKADPVEPTARQPDSHTRTLELWGETRPQRRGWDWRVRVMLYLYAVEGWDTTDIARAWGVTRGAVSNLFQRHLPGHGRDFNRCGSQRWVASPAMVARNRQIAADRQKTLGRHRAS